MNKKKIIIFAPHPDDETWGCGGTIAKKIEEGYEVLIVVMTDGRHAFTKMLGIYCDPTPEELKEIRKEETIRAAAILGVPRKKLTFLEFEDGKLEENEEIAEERVVKILEEINVEEVYFPYEKDYHPDHQAANRIVRNAIRKLGISPMKYQYSIVHKHGRIGPIIDAVLDLFKHCIVRVDISEFLSLKSRALQEMKSEVSIISPKQKEPLLNDMDKILKKVERFYLDK